MLGFLKKLITEAKRINEVCMKLEQSNEEIWESLGLKKSLFQCYAFGKRSVFDSHWMGNIYYLLKDLLFDF